ncbi:hypothetical protein NP493_509g00013 [Ridgeia piscesae]|uniref:KEN domain-containing protein n=1 Tax=Ridgeia piscesae TaxID=27915 RepID=A0AAD9KXE6_RIDPI|nr:hypothetical protein NP493_509g00013 [Ridgeia piscesae]
MYSFRHAFFWTDERRYKFLCVVGDQSETTSCDSKKHKNNSTVVAIESTGVLPTLSTGKKSWGELSILSEMDGKFEQDLKRKGYTQSVCHLLRMLRNIQSHYKKLPEPVKNILGNTRYPYAYFNAELPDLFPEMYFIIRSTAGTGDDWVQRNGTEEVLLKK